MEVTIDAATDEEARSGYVGRQLREFNYGHIGKYPEEQTIRLNARDAGCKVVGGLRAIVFMHWLRVEVLWVDAAIRGHGVGSRLLAEAERLALGMGANNALLETFEWQAPGFYENQGYRETARMANYIGGFYLAIMRKPLRGPVGVGTGVLAAAAGIAP